MYYYKLTQMMYKNKRCTIIDNTATEYAHWKRKLQTRHVRTNYGKKHLHYQVILLLNIRDTIDFSLAFQQYKIGIRTLIINNNVSLN